MRKKFSIKGVADYMTATESQKRKIIRQYKYPQEDEARARIMYYREARDRIAAYHAVERDPRWFEARALELDSLAASSSKMGRLRLRNNARALRDYAKHFSSREFEVLEDLKLQVAFEEVVISIRPDLYVCERGKEKIVKLEFSKSPPSKDVVKIITQGMFEAARQEGLDLKSSQVLYLDVSRGIEHRGARLGAKMRTDMEAACRTISDVWQGI